MMHILWQIVRRTHCAGLLPQHNSTDAPELCITQCEHDKSGLHGSAHSCDLSQQHRDTSI